MGILDELESLHAVDAEEDCVVAGRAGRRRRQRIAAYPTIDGGYFLNATSRN